MKTYYLLGLEDGRMVALAQVLSDLGHTVKVGDHHPLQMTERQRLERKGVVWEPLQDESNLEGAEMIVLEEHYDQAKERFAKHVHLQLHGYHRFFGQLLRRYTSIAIHGVQEKKTLAQWVCKTFGSLSPTAYLLDERWAKGAEEDSYFIYEGYEETSARSAYQPDYAVITSMNDQLPHPYRNKQELRQTFLTMASQVRKRVVACGDDLNTHILLTARPVLYYGFGLNNDLVAKNVREVSRGLTFDVYVDKQFLQRFQINRRDPQTVQQALAIIGVALLEGFELEKLQKSIREHSTYGSR